MGLVYAVVLAAQVKCPVRLEVPVVDDGAEPEDGLGALEAPPGAGDVEAVADQVAGCAFDDAGGDRPSGGECLVVVQVLHVVGQVAHARFHAGLSAFGQPVLAGLGGEGGGDLPGPAGQHRQRLDGDPVFGGRGAPWAEGPGGVALRAPAADPRQRLDGDPVFGGRVVPGVEAPGGGPQVLQHVHEVKEEVNFCFAAGGLGFDQLDLVAIPVGQHHPGAQVSGVAGPGLAEGGGDDLAGVAGD